MKLKNCDISNNLIAVSKPPIKSSPDIEWTQAYKNNRIPKEVYNLYSCADYFSINKIPHFLKEENGKLFFYLSCLVESIRKAFDESYDLVEEMKIYQKNSYSPIKEMKGVKYDPKAALLKFRCFKYLLVNLASSLDQLAEVLALFFPEKIPKLCLGRASFSGLVSWLRDTFNSHTGNNSPEMYYLKMLHQAMSDKITGKGPEKEWLELFFLYRNKLAHLGDAIFPKYEFHDNTGEFYTFTPKVWPHSIEEHIKLNPSPREFDSNPVKKFAMENLIHQDIIEYTSLLVKKIEDLLNSGFKILCKCYRDFRDFEPNKKALYYLKSNSKKYAFCYFKNTSDT